MTKQEFIKMIVPLAQEEQKETGILASVTIAQACLESGYGTSELAVNANNLFGMKCMLSGNTWESVWDGVANYEKETQEQGKGGNVYSIIAPPLLQSGWRSAPKGGNVYSIIAQFRKYPDIAASIRDHSLYLLQAMNGEQSRYAGLAREQDYRKAAAIIKNGGYATDINYVDKICQVIEKWDLTKYDKEREDKNMRICLDAGHYGKYNQSPVNSQYYESDMVWKLHLMLKKYLETYGFEVITTRPEQAADRELYSRGAASRGCNLFLSIHSNAAEKAAVDYPVSYCAINGSADQIGLRLSKCVQSIMGTNQEARIEHRTGSHGDYYGVVRGATAVGTPGLILEHSFHTNPQATAWLLNDKNLDMLARVEAESIAQYYGLKKEKKSGWRHEDGGERFYLGDSGQYVKNDWYQYEGNWYWFDGAGHMVTDTWYQYNGAWYYLGEDGAMVKGLQSVDGNWYYLDQDGRMSTDPVLLIPDKDGALQYPGLVM